MILLALVHRKQKPLKVTLTTLNMVPNCNLQFHLITNCDVAEIIAILKPKTSTNIDNISSKLLKQTLDSITESLTIIVNEMLKTGTFPELLKTSKVHVIPLYKTYDIYYIVFCHISLCLYAM